MREYKCKASIFYILKMAFCATECKDEIKITVYYVIGVNRCVNCVEVTAKLNTMHNTTSNISVSLTVDGLCICSNELIYISKCFESFTYSSFL